MIRKLMFRVARLKFMGTLLGFSFTYLQGYLPLNKVYLSKSLYCFFHPVPFFEPHVLIIPRKIVRTLFDITNENLFVDVLNASIIINEKLDKPLNEFVVFANGGIRQDVMQVHFHMTDPSMVNIQKVKGKTKEIESNNNLPLRINPPYKSSGLQEVFCNVMKQLVELKQQNNLKKDGFTLYMLVIHNKDGYALTNTLIDICISQNR